MSKVPVLDEMPSMMLECSLQVSRKVIWSRLTRLRAPAQCPQSISPSLITWVVKMPH